MLHHSTDFLNILGNYDNDINNSTDDEENCSITHTIEAEIHAMPISHRDFS